MPTVKKSPARSSSTSRKEVRQQIARKLENALSDLKAILGDKKFRNRIKKASKLLSYDPGSNGSPKTPVRPKRVTKAASARKKTPDSTH